MGPRAGEGCAGGVAHLSRTDRERIDVEACRLRWADRKHIDARWLN